MTALYTVGHSNRELQCLLDLLGQAGVRVLVDVRAHPRSGRFPQFNEDSLRQALDSPGIVYHWAGHQLGGMRGYADYMETEAFRHAATELMAMAEQAPVAIMCAERNPDDCHRSLISDYLSLQGVEVTHLIDLEQSFGHLLRPEARRESAELVYDRHAQGELGL